LVVQTGETRGKNLRKGQKVKKRDQEKQGENRGRGKTHGQKVGGGRTANQKDI